jgi:hypothetical protein
MPFNGPRSLVGLHHQKPMAKPVLHNSFYLARLANVKEVEMTIIPLVRLSDLPHTGLVQPLPMNPIRSEQDALKWGEAIGRDVYLYHQVSTNTYLAFAEKEGNHEAE